MGEDFERSNRRVLLGFYGVCIFIVLLAILPDLFIRTATVPRIPAPTSNTAFTSASIDANSSLAYKLASVDKGYSVDADDPAIARFAYLLQELDSKTRESQTQIADMLASGQQLLRTKYGREVGLLELTEAANQAIPEEAKSANLNFAEILAALIAVMARG